MKPTKVALLGALIAGQVATFGQTPSSCSVEWAGVRAETGRLCQEEMPESGAQCHEMLDRLAGIREPTPDERLALAWGRYWAAVWAGDAEREEAFELSLRDELRRQVAARPDDPELLRLLAAYEADDDRRMGLLRRVVELDPACSSVSFFLVEELWWRRDEEGDREAAAAAAEYLAQAYERAVERTWKIHFALMAYRDHRWRDMPEKARAVRRRAMHDLGLGSLPFDAVNRADSLAFICHQHAFELEFDELCLEAIEGLAEQDRRAGGPVRDDVWRAVEAVAGAARDKGLFGARATDHLVRMRDLLDAEPEWGRTPAYHMAYSKAVGRPRAVERGALGGLSFYEPESGEPGSEAWRALEVESLRRAVALDPGDGRAGLMLARALYAAGRKDEAIEAYREVMANDDGRHRADEPDQDYRRRAGTLLRSLESDIRAGRH